VLRADLPDDLHSELEALARHAFRALGLRDYARFDIRLSSGGTLFFLEANTTPSLEPLEALALSARWAGLEYPALVERMLSEALGRYEALPSAKRPSVRVDLPTGPIELEIPEGVHVPPASSIDLAGLLDVRQGEDVLDLGCGSGLLSIAAAKLGARHVVAIDLDPGRSRPRRRTPIGTASAARWRSVRGPGMSRCTDDPLSKGRMSALM